MIDYKIIIPTENELFSRSTVAYADHNAKCVGIGANIDKLNKVLDPKNKNLHPYYKQFKNASEFYEHET